MITSILLAAQLTYVEPTCMDAVALLQDNHSDKAFHIFHQLALEHNVCSQLYLSKMFRKGIYVNQDINLANYWELMATKKHIK